MKRDLTYNLSVCISILIISYATNFALQGTMFLVSTILLAVFLILQPIRTRLRYSGITQKSALDLHEIESDSDKKAPDIFTAFDNCPIASIIIDENFNIIQANHASYIILGVSINELCCFSSFLSTESKDILATAIKAHASQQQNDNEPLELQMTENKTILMYISDLAYSENSRFLLNIVDVSKYKIFENNFVHAQKMHALGQLSGAIAHDFNNLLTAIIGFCDLLLVRHPPGDKSFTELMQIKQNSNRAANLVRQLLAFSRKQVMQPSIMNLTDSIAELSTLISRLIGSDIELVIEHGKDLLPVKVDQSQFEQVIINLVVNARDAMPHGGKLTIATNNVRIDDNFLETKYYIPVGEDSICPGDYVLITISDTGSGIASHLLDKIFEPFFSTKDPASGTGLGLSTVLGIIKQTGGYVRLQTTQNIGATFFIFLRSVECDAVLLNSVDRIEEHYEKLTIKASTKSKILVVEDEAPVRMFSVYALSNKGYEVLEADSAEAALNIIMQEGQDLDLVIADVIMPGMTGTSMFERINQSHPHIQFIFTSGYAESAISYLSNKQYHFLGKPYTLRELLNKVHSLLVDK